MLDTKSVLGLDAGAFLWHLEVGAHQWQDELTIVWMEFLSTSTRFVSTSGPANMASAGSCCRTWHAAGHKSL